MLAYVSLLNLLSRELQGVLQGARLMMVDLQQSASIMGNASSVIELLDLPGKGIYTLADRPEV